MGGIEFWRTATIIAAAAGQTAFVMLYLTWPWWNNFLGRALFLKAFAFALLLDVAVIGRMVDWDSEPSTIVSLYGAVAVGVWVQFVAFLVVRVEGRRNYVMGVSGNEDER